MAKSGIYGFLAKVRETGWFGGFAIFSRTRAGRRGRAIIEEKPPHSPRPGCHPYGITNFGQEPTFLAKHTSVGPTPWTVRDPINHSASLRRSRTMPFLQPDASQACGARNRHGEPCKNWPARQSRGVRRRCRFHGGHSLRSIAHPGYTHGYRSRVLREVAEILQKGAVLSFWDNIVLTKQVREKRA